MMIRPITNVSYNYNSVNSVNFEGRKNKENRSHVPMALKAVPLATLLAMSPLNLQAAQPSDNVSVEQTSSNERLWAALNLPDDLGLGGAAVLNLYDTNGDPNNAEKAILHINIYNGKTIKDIDISNGFTIKTTNYRDGSEPSVSCYTKGEVEIKRRKSDGQYAIEKRVKKTNIDKRAVDYLNEFFEGAFEIRYETVTEDSRPKHYGSWYY